MQMEKQEKEQTFVYTITICPVFDGLIKRKEMPPSLIHVMKSVRRIKMMTLNDLALYKFLKNIQYELYFRNSYNKYLHS